jgi:hypothetical protein
MSPMAIFLFVLSEEVYLHGLKTNKKMRGKNLASANFRVEDGARTHDKKSSYSTHYQQVATATFKHLQIGLQIRTQLFVV